MTPVDPSYNQGVIDTLDHVATLIDDAQPNFTNDPAAYFKEDGVATFKQALKAALAEYRRAAEAKQ